MSETITKLFVSKARFASVAAAFLAVTSLIVSLQMLRVSAVREREAESGVEIPQQDRREVEQITLQLNGFNPGQITRPEGRFILSVHNRSGLDNIKLQFGQENGSRVPALESRKRRLSWADEVDLPPGRYVLSEVSHPRWRCLITITAR